MYKLRIEPVPDSDASTEKFTFVVNDLAASIACTINDVDEDEMVITNSRIMFHTLHTEKEIKEKLKPVFSHHIDILRFSSIEKC